MTCTSVWRFQSLSHCLDIQILLEEVFGLSLSGSKICVWEPTSPKNTLGGWVQDIGIWRLTDRGESLVVTGGRSTQADPHVGWEEVRLYRYRKQRAFMGETIQQALLVCTQCPKKPGDLDASQLIACGPGPYRTYILIHFCLTASTLHSSDLLASRIKEICFAFLLDQHVHKYPNAKRINF